MKPILKKSTYLALAFLLIFTGNAFAQQSVTYRTAVVCGTGVHILQVNMNDKKVKVTPLLSQPAGRDESFTGMMNRTKPTAAVTGTFFSRTTLKPIGDVVIDGNLKTFGGFGTALAITPDNRVFFLKVVWGHKTDWTGYETVVAGGPRLLRDGKIVLNARAEGFKDPHVLGTASRIAVGKTKNNQLLFVATGGVTLERLADIMLKLGCVDAMNLEGGASIAMYYRGSYPVVAGRKLTNVIEVFEKFGEREVMAAPVVTTDAGSYSSAGESGSPGSLSPDKLYEKAFDEYNKGNLTVALRYITQAVKMNPTAANYRVLGQVQEGLGNNKEASSAYAEISRLYYEMHDYNASVAMARRAIQLDSENDMAQEYYNRSQEKRGKR